MGYKVIITPETEDDIEKAVEYYIEIQTKLAKQFLSELKKVYKYITNNPESIQIRYKNIRIAFLKKFPYGIHYTLNKNEITIIAVFSTSEDPNIWSKR